MASFYANSSRNKLQGLKLLTKLFTVVVHGEKFDYFSDLTAYFKIWLSANFFLFDTYLYVTVIVDI